MKNFITDIKTIYTNERLMLIIMIFNLLASLGLFVFGMISLKPSSAVVKIGYGDIGGYRDGSWADILAFPLFAIIFGIFHNLIALRIFRKRGAGVTKFFLVTTTALIIGAFVVLIRLTREG